MLNSNLKIKKSVASAQMSLLGLIIALNTCCCHSASATKGDDLLSKANSSKNKITRSNSLPTLRNPNQFDNSDSSSSYSSSYSSDDSSDSDEIDPYVLWANQTAAWILLAEKFSGYEDDTHLDSYNGSDTDDPDSFNAATLDDINTTPLKVFHKDS